eukprot:TRINITY_DN1139_c0_g1_i11.p1 TRINITY_DN1139_c0_g1~~TRINITY_DN1139_c0_g1_i11.p1  ORF type:complete len:281 (-),score=49.49 TRINITY_DN1139_c0_g1_i11:820-1662(-)
MSTQLLFAGPSITKSPVTNILTSNTNRSEYCKQYYYQNKERLSLSKKIYREENRELVLERERRSKLKKKERMTTGVPTVPVTKKKSIFDGCGISSLAQISKSLFSQQYYAVQKREINERCRKQYSQNSDNILRQKKERNIMNRDRSRLYKIRYCEKKKELVKMKRSSHLRTLETCRKLENEEKRAKWRKEKKEEILNLLGQSDDVKVICHFFPVWYFSFVFFCSSCGERITFHSFCFFSREFVSRGKLKKKKKSIINFCLRIIWKTFWESKLHGIGTTFQ